MGRKILFVTTDQQRYDTLGCNGGLLSRTPVIDNLAATGHRYERAVPQSVVCMPSRSTNSGLISVINPSGSKDCTPSSATAAAQARPFHHRSW